MPKNLRSKPFIKLPNVVIPFSDVVKRLGRAYLVDDNIEGKQLKWQEQLTNYALLAKKPFDITTEHVAVPISEYMGKGESILVVDDVKEQRSLA